jgi:hypothetical protein
MLFDFSWLEAERAQETAGEARRSATALADEVRALRKRLDEQAVVLQALARLLTDKLGLTDAEVMDYVRHAQADRTTGEARTCTACGNKLPPRKVKCIYCGADQAPERVDDVV